MYAFPNLCAINLFNAIKRETMSRMPMLSPKMSRIESLVYLQKLSSHLLFGLLFDHVSIGGSVSLKGEFPSCEEA